VRSELSRAPNRKVEEPRLICHISRGSLIQTGVPGDLDARAPHQPQRSVKHAHSISHIASQSNHDLVASGIVRERTMHVQAEYGRIDTAGCFL
jgi:hypothetical protein